MKTQAALISKSRCTNVDSADVDLKATDAACLLDLFVYLSLKSFIAIHFCLEIQPR